MQNTRRAAIIAAVSAYIEAEAASRPATGSAPSAATGAWGLFGRLDALRSREIHSLRIKRDAGASSLEASALRRPRRQ